MTLLLIPFLPLVSFVILIFLGRWLGKFAPLVSLTALAGSAILSVQAFLSLTHSHTHTLIHNLHPTWDWIAFGGRTITLGLVADPLSVTMCLVVTVIGWAIMLYSVGYMAGDARYTRFFAYLSLFFTAMLTLVLADHLILLYIGWELVGLCSYLLISFWFEKPAAANAGKKAFLTTRVGDLGLLLGILILALHGDNLSFEAIRLHAGTLGPWAAVAAALIFWGAVGKSAQFPLHVWLPDAMEGPTAVSALIHAATMVAAGVYLVARTFSLFVAGPEAMAFVAWTGAITTFGAATIACTQTELKKILAYSTISQLGFMMLALGCGSAFAGMFHLVTHAWFKALLFLCAGSVIHAMHHQDITRMGGLIRKMPITAITFSIAAFAMAGVPPLAGFWSKEAVLMAASQAHAPLFMAAAVGTALLTAFYITRAVILTFFGKEREENHAHESPWTMTVPLIFLAVGAVAIGWINTPWNHHWYAHFMHLGETGHHGNETGILVISLLCAGGGIGAAVLRYGFGIQLLPAPARRALRPLYVLAVNKYFIDEIYSIFIIWPFKITGRFFFAIDRWIIDGLVNCVGFSTLILSKIEGWFDKWIVDGLVNLAGAAARGSGSALRLLQTGLVQNYLLVASVSGILLFLILMRGTV